MKKITAVFLALLLVLSLAAVPVSAADRAWEDAYAAAIKKNADSWGNYFQLVDMDMDGTPELIIGSRPGSGLFSEVEYAATFKNGAIKQLSVGSGIMLSTSGYTMYRNSAGSRKIEGTYTLRAGAGYYSSVTASYWITATELRCASSFVEDHEGNTVNYYVSGAKTTAAKYKAAYNSRNSGWTKVSPFLDFETYASKKISTADAAAFLAQWPSPADRSTHSITVAGVPVTAGAYTINGNNYFKLRDIAALLKDTEAGFEVTYNEKTKAIDLLPGQSYSPEGDELSPLAAGTQSATLTASPISVNGKSISCTVYFINGNNYFKLRDLGKALNFGVTWDEATRTVGIEPGQPYSE